MKKGKISESVLKRSVLKYSDQTNSTEILKGAAIGSDCAFLRYKESSLSGEGTQLISTQCYTFPVRDAGKMAVHAAMGNLAAGGGEGMAVLLGIVMPLEQDEADLKEVMRQIRETCALYRVGIAGGHTEFSAAVKTPVITVTALGNYQGSLPQELPRKERAFLDIVMTKWIGLEGTCLLAREKEQMLLRRYPFFLIEEAGKLERFLPVGGEAALAVQAGVYAMHDFRNGGIFGGLYELAGRLGTGLSVDLKKIPVRQETIEICEFFDLNPYELLSGGSLLLVCENGEELADKLMQQGIPAVCIGRTTDNNDKIVVNDEEIRFLEPAKPDEILKVIF